VVVTKVYRASEDALEWSELASAEFEYHAAFLLEGVKVSPAPAPSEPTEPTEDEEAAEAQAVQEVSDTRILRLWPCAGHDSDDVLYDVTTSRNQLPLQSLSKNFGLSSREKKAQ